MAHLTVDQINRGDNIHVLINPAELVPYNVNTPSRPAEAISAGGRKYCVKTLKSALVGIVGRRPSYENSLKSFEIAVTMGNDVSVVFKL